MKDYENIVSIQCLRYAFAEESARQMSCQLKTEERKSNHTSLAHVLPSAWYLKSNLLPVGVTYASLIHLLHRGIQLLQIPYVSASN